MPRRSKRLGDGDGDGWKRNRVKLISALLQAVDVSRIFNLIFVSIGTVLIKRDVLTCFVCFCKTSVRRRYSVI